MDSNEKQEQKDLPTKSMSMLLRRMPDLGIKLSKVYEFNIAGGAATFVDGGKSVSDISYVLDDHLQLSRHVNKIDITKHTTLDLPPGVTIVIGKSGSGKTKLTLAHMTALNENVVYARFGEPLDHRFVDLLTTQAAAQGVTLVKFEVDLANLMAQFLTSPDTDVLIVDSLRYLFYAGGGSTGKGGVNMTLFSDLSFLDLVASQMNKSLVVVVNPMSDDDVSYKAIVEAAKGSVAAIVDVASPTTIRYSSRYEERDWRSISLPDSASIDRTAQRLNVQTTNTSSLRSIL